ncbi:nucleoside diphosphate kinase regulator [Hyphomicrobium sp.]|uniref:nucleoside diphosphate kinase regulator n=1 Tax=Hyphomicrobium sp. TaxID=82 RepID=UPI002FDEDCEB
MVYNSPVNELPQIVVGEGEENRLSTLASSAMSAGRSEKVAQVLLSEMERAVVVPDAKVPETVVRMNSRIVFSIDGGEKREVELVFPGEANIDQGKISVLTPIGSALIGLSSGQAMTVNGADGRPHELTVISVLPPRAEL